MPSSHQYAVVAKNKCVAELVSTASIPQPGANQIVVQTKAVALNPSEWMLLDLQPAPGAILGSDYAGVVESVGSDVTKFAVGDRVAGLVRGNSHLHKEDGAFAEHVVGFADMATHIPDSLRFEKAATLGMGVVTASQALYQDLNLPMPLTEEAKSAPTRTLLIYAGSTATGTLAIQLAKQSGVRVITTCSPANIAHLKSLGADAVLNYRDPDSILKIRELSENRLSLALDCIGTTETAEYCVSCFGKSGGSYCSLISVPHLSRSDIKNGFRIVYSTFGRDDFIFGKPLPGTKEDHDLATKAWTVVEELLKLEKLRPHPIEIGKDGLKGVLNGIERLRRKEVSGKKVVYRVEDTPKDEL